jgi:hypothetical protein
MHHTDPNFLQRCWTLSGRYFGNWEGDDLWTCNGRHVGRLRGAEIFAPDGQYMGELMPNGRLAVRSRKIGIYGNAYIAWPPRVGHDLLPTLDPGTHRIGYEDFPGPNEFQPQLFQPGIAGFPASVLC